MSVHGWSGIRGDGESELVVTSEWRRACGEGEGVIELYSHLCCRIGGSTWGEIGGGFPESVKA